MYVCILDIVLLLSMLPNDKATYVVNPSNHLVNSDISESF